MNRSVARAALLTAAILLVACDAPTATRSDTAYDPTVLTGGLLYRWASGATVHVWVAGGSTTSGMDLGLAVRQAITRWNAIPQFAEFTLVETDDIKSADLVVYDRATDAPVLPGSCPFDARSSAGYTYFCPGSTAASPRRAELLPLAVGGVSAVRVIIRLDRGRVTTQSGYNAVVAHEFGHALGIGAHSDQAADLMFGLPTIEAPSARDVATLRSLLGRAPGVTL